MRLSPRDHHNAYPQFVVERTPPHATTVFPAYNDTFGTWAKCHCNQIVTVTRDSEVTNQSFGTCPKCHCKQGVTVNSVTVSGEICNNSAAVPLINVILDVE